MSQCCFSTGIHAIGLGVIELKLSTSKKFGGQDMVVFRFGLHLSSDGIQLKGYCFNISNKPD